MTNVVYDVPCSVVPMFDFPEIAGAELEVWDDFVMSAKNTPAGRLALSLIAVVTLTVRGVLFEPTTTVAPFLVVVVRTRWTVADSRTDCPYPSLL